MKRPRLALVADSQELFSYSLMRLLEQHLEYVKITNTATFADAMHHLELHPNTSFAAFELNLPGMDGLSNIGHLRIAYPELRIAIIADSTHREDILRALAVGVHGYIPRSLSLKEAIQALNSLASGNIYVPPQLSEVMDSGLEPRFDIAGPPAQMLQRLTTRQHQVLSLIAEGKSNKAIATLLQLSEGTVKVHVNAIFQVLGIHTRAGVADLARTLAGKDENDTDAE